MNMKLSSNGIFKVMILIFTAYFLYVLTLIAMQMRRNEDVGRYQFRAEGFFIIDTKTGEVKRFARP
jgi:hypothetical protein